MSSWNTGQRPLTITILAMGGEGGGVLSNWVADTARAAGWTTQNTSVAGVAQRTGATIYYLELFQGSSATATNGGAPASSRSFPPCPHRVRSMW